MSKKTEEKILTAARKVFSEKGFHGSTTKEIAIEAGVAEGTIFRHFKTKKELLEKLIIPIVFQSAEDLLSSNKDKPFEEFLSNIFVDRIQMFKKFFPVLKLVLLESEVDPDVRRQWFSNLMSKISHQIEDIIKEKIRIGELREVNPVYATKTFMVMVFGTGIMNELSGGLFFNNENVENFVSGCLDIYMNGVSGVSENVTDISLFDYFDVMSSIEKLKDNKK